MRVVTITLNPAIDTTYVVDRLEPGGAVRPVRQYDMPGGKGNNVARILARFGHDVIATGFVGGPGGDAITAGLRDAGVEPAFARLDGRESRTCIAILERSTGVVTEILEAGPSVDTADYDHLLARLRDILPGADAVVISGSAPAGSARADLARVAAAVREHSARMLVDSSGTTLDALLEGRPDVIKPNEHEMDTLIGHPATFAERVRYARESLLAERMAPGGAVLMTLGADGGALVQAHEALTARIPHAPPVNTVGCGDAALAGFVDASLAGQPPTDALRRAMAFGVAAARHPVAGVVDPPDIAGIERTIEIARYADEIDPIQRT